MRHPSHLLVALLAALVAGACGGGSSGPRSTLDRYSEALASHDYGKAYGLMSRSFQAKHSRDEFIRTMRENAREAGETAARLKASPESAEVTAEFGYGLGDSMRLVQEGGDWRIASNPVAFYDQSTPRAALRSFLRAYRLQRWDILLRFVPTKYRERMDVGKLREQFAGAHREEMEVRMNMLEANLEEPIVDKNNEARMPYGERYEVKFVREDGDWKIKDID
jgi:hypothetical protein